MFTFTPLLGAQSESPASQSLLEFDGGVKILVDVGWDEGFDAEMLLELEKCVEWPSYQAISLKQHNSINMWFALVGMCRPSLAFCSLIPQSTISVPWPIAASTFLCSAKFLFMPRRPSLR